MAKHWTDADFRVVTQTPAFDGSTATNDYGYCAKCLGDMQRHGEGGKPGTLKHYSSHGTAKRIGLWGRQPSRSIKINGNAGFSGYPL